MLSDPTFGKLPLDLTDLKLLSAVLEAVNDAIVITEQSVRIVYANEAYLRMSGYGLSEVIGKSPRFLQGSGTCPTTLDRIRQKIQAWEPFREEILNYRKDGTPFWVELNVRPLDNEEGYYTHWVSVQRDVTAQHEAMDNLSRSEERFRLIANATSDVLWDYDFETGLTWSSPDWPAKLGLQYDQRNIQNFQWVEMVDPSDRAPLISSFQAAIKCNARTWGFEFKAHSVAGEDIYLAVKASILRNPDGRASRILGNMRNITKEKRNQEGYTRARALEAVGQLTGGVAHDFNNMLMIILGNSEFLETTGLDEDQAESVAMIHQASSSAADLTRRLLSFSRQSRLRAGCVELTNLIPNTVALLRVGIPETISIRCDLNPGLWQANVDPNALEQAIINLAVNARDAMPNGGEVVISAENQTISSEMQSNLLELELGDYLVVSVTDTGHGMPPEVLARAFEPFFTTKDVGEGTGLGLSTVFGFAKQSGGHATIQSEPGHGTVVRIYLPRFGTGEEQEGPLPEAVNAGAGAGQRILIVEDEPMVRAHVERLLSKLGYHVTAAADGQEALSLLRDGQTFDLLFTDVIMPGGMTGPKLGQAALRLAPHIKLLYTSGYPAAAFENLDLEDLTKVNFLAKPYRSAQLKEKLAAILGASPSAICAPLSGRRRSSATW